MMHLQKNHVWSTTLNGIKLLLIIVVVQTVCTKALSPEEIMEAVSEASPARYCGKRLNEAMKTFCTPTLRNMIMRRPSKKSLDSTADMDFESFDVDRAMSYNYDDELGRTHYKTDDSLYSTDIHSIFPSQANRRHRRGIIEECCKRACYKSELVQYCPPSRG